MPETLSRYLRDTTLGTDDARGKTSAAARTFPTHNATIGLAYACRQIVRSLRDVVPADLKAAMTPLKLNAASREMSGDVGFVLAIPLLEPEEQLRYTSPAPVVGVMYIDSNAKGFFIDNKELSGLVFMAQEFLNGLERAESTPFDRIRNVPLTGYGTEVPPAGSLPKRVRNVLELVTQIGAPKTSRPFQLNYDYSDFVPVQGLRR